MASTDVIEVTESLGTNFFSVRTEAFFYSSVIWLFISSLFSPTLCEKYMLLFS